MFMYLGTAEKAGSGVDKILQGWKEANFRSPQIEEKTKPDKVTLTLPLVGLLSDNVISHLKTLNQELLAPHLSFAASLYHSSNHLLLQMYL